LEDDSIFWLNVIFIGFFCKDEINKNYEVFRKSLIIPKMNKPRAAWVTTKSYLKNFSLGQNLFVLSFLENSKKLKQKKFFLLFEFFSRIFFSRRMKGVTKTGDFLEGYSIFAFRVVRKFCYKE